MLSIKKETKTNVSLLSECKAKRSVYKTIRGKEIYFLNRQEVVDFRNKMRTDTD